MATTLNSRAFDNAKELVLAGQRRYRDIELAVAHLHGMVDALHDTGRARSC